MDRGLRIETIIAFSSGSPGLLQSFLGSVYYASGGQLIKEDLSTGKQEATTIHHSPILSMHVTNHPSGGLLATGHSLAYSGAVQKAFIFITNPADLSTIKILDGMSSDVQALRFSPDGAFLAAIDNQGKLVIWGTKEFNVISSRFFEKKITCFEWGPIDSSKRMPEYHLVSTNNSQIEVHRMVYDIATITYKMVYQSVQLPNTGLNRYYECNTVHPATNYYYSGTRGGELCVVDVKNKLFKASVQVGKSSLRSLYMDFAANIAYCGFSNGQLKILSGTLDKWVIVKEFQLDGSQALT